jgi:hypothetical protein
LKAKIIEIFSSFSDSDYEKFGEFISSVYYNKSSVLRKFYKILLKYAPDFNENKVSKENIFNEIYPGKVYNEARMLNLLSGLYKLSEKFILTESFRQDPLAGNRFLLAGLNERKLNKFFINNYKKIQNELNNTVLQDEPYFKWRHEIEFEYYSFLSQNNTLYYLDKTPIQGYLDKFIEYFIIKSLLNYHHVYNTRYLIDQNFEIPFLESIPRYLEMHGLDKNPAISIHYYVYMLIKEKKDIFFYKLKDLMKQYPGIMGRLDTFNTYIVMINYCIAKWRNAVKNNEFVNETFGIYKYVVENGIYKFDINAKMVHTFYYNTVQSGLALKEFTWVEDFINRYYKDLEEKHKLFTFNLCYASYYFNTRDYEKSLECLNKIDRKHPYFNRKINSLTIQNYYELDLYENAFSHLDSFRHFLKENNLESDQDKNREMNFINVLNNLLKIKSGTKKAVKTDLELMKELNNTANNKWLYQKITELERNVK